MPSFAEMLRLKNLFGQPPIGSDLPSEGGITGTMFGNNPSFEGMFAPKQDPYGNMSFGPPSKVAIPESKASIPFSPQPEPAYDVNRRMKEIYQPETVATERFNQGISDYPASQKPSWLRAMLAAAAEVGNKGSGMGVIEGDRPRRLADWKAKMGPLQDAANLERYSNSNNRSLANQTINQELRQQADTERDKNNDAKTKIAQQRADAYVLKTQNPNRKFNFSGPTVIMTEDDGTVTDTKIPTGSLSETDKITMNQKNAMARITAGGKQTQENMGVRHDFTMDEIEARGDEARETKVVVPGKAGSGSKEELPLNTARRRVNAANQLKNTRPDLAKFVRVNGDEIHIVQPDRSFFGDPTGPNPQQVEEINKIIYGPSKSNIPTGKVKVRDKNGKTYYLPSSQIEQAIKQGYTQVE